MDKEIKKYHKDGLSNRQIAICLKLHHSTINSKIKEFGLIPNGRTRGEKLLIKNGKAVCRECQLKLPIEQFKLLRGNADYPYRLTYCKKCQIKKYTKYINSNKDAWWRRRYYGWKKKAKERGIEFGLKVEYIKFLFDIQDGKCAYTGEELKTTLGNGLLDNSLSLDRVNNSKGYIPGNVLMCTRQFNTLKGNISEPQFKKWMPGIYKKYNITLKKVIRMWRSLGLDVEDVGKGIEF